MILSGRGGRNDKSREQKQDKEREKIKFKTQGKQERTIAKWSKKREEYNMRFEIKFKSSEPKETKLQKNNRVSNNES